MPPAGPSIVDDDTTSATAPERDSDQMALHLIYHYAVPITCAFGIIGNLLNLKILSDRRIVMIAPTVMEKAANICFRALALSDMGFCFCAFFAAFVSDDNKYDSSDFFLYFRLYGWAVINIFIFSSTWITVVLAGERYLSVCHIAAAQRCVNQRNVISTLGLVFFGATVFNLPIFWRYHGEQLDNTTRIIVKERDIINDFIDKSYRVGWIVLGNFIPLIFLAFANVSLIVKAHKVHMMAQRRRDAQAASSSSAEQRLVMREEPRQNQGGGNISKLTVSLVAIVILFFLLVAPTDLIRFVLLVSKDSRNSTVTAVGAKYDRPDYKVVEGVLNYMQTVNFAINFLVYCAVNETFRIALWHYCLCFFCLRDDDWVEEETPPPPQPMAAGGQVRNVY